MHRANARAGKHRLNGLWHHRHIDNDPIPFGHTFGLKATRQKRDTFLQFCIGNFLNRAGDGAVIDDSGAIPMACGNMAIDRVPTTIQLTICKPFIKRRVFIRQRVGWFNIPINGRSSLHPKPFWVGTGILINLLIAHAGLPLLAQFSIPSTIACARR